MSDNKITHRQGVKLLLMMLLNKSQQTYAASKILCLLVCILYRDNTSKQNEERLACEGWQTKYKWKRSDWKKKTE